MNDNTPWTSIDAYYKGFHTKFSFPETITREKVITMVEGLIDAGFEPSWNKETSGEQLKVTDPIDEATKDHDLGVCSKCGEPNARSKKGNVYCTGKCWLK